VDITRPSAARVWDYFLGGTHNFAVDRQVADEAIRFKPDLPDLARAVRVFLRHSVAHMATAGIDQFIDIGAGLPTQNNTHEVVHKVAPDARVVYVDHDPEVEAYSRPLLKDVPNARAVTADLRDPASVLDHQDTRALIDFSQPVGLLLVAVVHFVSDETDPWGLLARYRDALVPGSHLALSHITDDNQPERPVQAIRSVYENATENIHFRTKADVDRLFTGWDLVPPYKGADAAVTWIGYWGAEDPEAADSDGSRWSYAGVARKPEIS
jgi:S-adenosyl methyltransferase